MCVRISCALIATLAVAVQQSFAQFTTVQLPTLQNFSMSTTVLVPDRGSVNAGGISSSTRTRSRYGSPLLPLSNQSVSTVNAASGVTVSSWIHDLDAMDRKLVRQWKEEHTVSDEKAGDANFPLSRPNRIANANPELGRPRVSQIRRQIEADRKTKIRYGHQYFQTADRLHRKGKLDAAKTVYRNAYRYGDDQLKVRVAARIRAIEAVAQRSPANAPATGKRQAEDHQ